MNTELRNRIFANDRLLKALITLISLRDPHLLDELKEIFEFAAETGNPMGDAPAGAWEHLREELEAIAALSQAAEQGLEH
ncbi:hypothetical protein SAMN05428963_105202 [Consotaella salsifontis]|uniref:Uncharacterized protein n=2 Tax=Consotaella salsifontis TaxID=1365950 RepID=A0A1T4QR89_9HYPH|nr:hypothetical protein SAMN05428963_105202 [Consotaella salsifontis]